MKKIFLKSLIVSIFGLLYCNSSKAQSSTFPYETGFESGISEWTIHKLQGDEFHGHISTDNGYPYSGNWSLLFYYEEPMGNSVPNERVTVAADLTIDLSNQSNDVMMDFVWQACDNILQSSGCNSLIGSMITDFQNCGIYFSENGTSFTKVYSLSGIHDWQNTTLNISDLAQQNNLTLNNQFIIRFQYEVIENTQGMGLDDLSIYSGCQEFYSFSNTSSLHTSPKSDGVYNVSDYITTGANVTIQNGTSVVFNVANSANMNIGFHAEAGSNFHAYLEGCSVAKSDAFKPKAGNQSFSTSDIRVFPNPTNGNINLQFSDPDAVQKVEIRDQFGKTMIQTSDVYITNSYNLNMYSKGIYFIYIYTANGVEVEKVIYQ